MAGAYLGVPLLGRGNTVTGVLHVLDRDPRPTVDRHAALLAAFGRAISDHLELRALSRPPDGDDQQAADIARAIRAGRIVPWYQPVADLSTGKIIGLEALARRILPDGRIESPAVFVPIAERSDLIVDLDVAVARVALKELKEWQRTNPALTMSVNLSGRHLNQDDWVARPVDLGSDAGVSPTTVQIEFYGNRPTLGLWKRWVGLDRAACFCTRVSSRRWLTFRRVGRLTFSMLST